MINTLLLTSENLRLHASIMQTISVSAMIESWTNLFAIGGVIALLGVGLLVVLNYRKFRSHQKANLLLLQTNQQLLLKISRLRENNQQLTFTEEELKNNNTTKDKFFSIIAHDLRGPLNSLTGLLQLLVKYADSFSKEELKDFSKNMDKSVNNLLDLLDNLFHWSQAQSGKIEYCPEEINLPELVNKTVSLLEPAATNKDINITVDISKGIVVFADKNMISFTIRNLISNAIKFTRPGGSVKIYTGLKDNEVEIAVADTGIGMSEQEVGKLFRIDKCYTTNGTANEIGTGLGLILCNEFIEKNKGKIFVESLQNKGSVFRFYLPVIAAGEQLPILHVH
jgi:signal transduction histidine kinase